MSTSFQVAGLASGFDWKSFVDQVMSLERTPANRLEAEKNTNSQKIGLISTLASRLSALQTAAQTLKTDSAFTRRTATSSVANSTWTATAAASATAGSYKISVSQLATTASLQGGSQVAAPLNSQSNDVSGLSVATLPVAQSITAGSFTVNGKKVDVTMAQSLQEVFDAIALATGNEVTASYDHVTDKVSLTSASGSLVLGAVNDTSNFLRALKLSNGDGPTATSSGRLGAVKSGAPLAEANLGSAITAVDESGNGTFAINGVNISYNVNTDSLSAVLRRINESTAGVTASYDAFNDRLVLTNKSTGDFGISTSEEGAGLLAALKLTGDASLSRGKNAHFTLNDGETLVSTSNTLTSAEHGVTGLSVTVKSASSETITVAPDTGAMRATVQSFVDKFNEVQQFIETHTKVTSDGKGKVTAAALYGNREIQEWARSLRSLAFNAISGLSGSITRLSDLGLDFKPGSSDLTIADPAKLDAALANSSRDVEAFFSTADTGFTAKIDQLLKNVTKQTGDQQTRLNNANKSIDSQIEAIDRRLANQRAVLEAAFIKMEQAQSQLKQQQSAIDGLWAQIQKK